MKTRTEQYKTQTINTLEETSDTVESVNWEISESPLKRLLATARTYAMLSRASNSAEYLNSARHCISAYKQMKKVA